ncbi:MAG: GNAT family N-acetyltransferase [Fusicatenibacter sp.]|nr:GNAT family N-acetyltransferase [Lachnospiraceae bacterium]MDY2937229.1 GNAT family N-acetyltransferase [Fusicatenibacter sp.]
MLETVDLVLDKAKFSDWKGMYDHVWSHPESAKYMLWRVTESEEDAKNRIQKTMEFQKTHDTYLVYERASGEPIGIAGVEKIAPFIYQEAGICLGSDYVGRGYGKQILQCLIRYCREEHQAKEFYYSTREENVASNKLALSFGFEKVSEEMRTDGRTGQEYCLVKYKKIL